MKKIILAAIGFFTLAAAPQIRAQSDSADDPAPIADLETGLEAWAKLYTVFSHPRCANCHVEDGRPMWSGPNYGETRKHGMFVGGNPDNLLGEPGMMCTTCHMAENSKKPHGPPGAEVWFMAPKEFVWWEKSSAEICAQVKDPERNGGRSLEDIHEHIADDPLVAWGWNPGPGREPAPYSAEEAAQFVTDWMINGAPCPADG